LKIRLQNDREVARDLDREVELFRFLEKNVSTNKISVPPVLTFGKYRNLQWYLRRYQDGTLAGQMKDDHGFSKKFLDKVFPREFAEAISDYQNCDLKEVRKLRLHYHGNWWYRRDFDFYRKNFLAGFIRSDLNDNFLSKGEVEEIDELLKKSGKLLDREAKYLCHGDLYPNNVLITPEGKIVFLDWGISNFNNPAFDVAFVYLGAWRSKKWREDFLKHYLMRQKNRKNFAEFFRRSLISLTIRFSGHCWRHIKDEKTPEAEKNKLFSVLKNHLKILRTVLRKSGY